MSGDDISSLRKKIIFTPILLSMFFTMLVVGVFFAQASSDIRCTDDLDGKSDKELAAALAKCEEEIAGQQTLLTNTQRDSVTIERDIAILEYNVNKAKAEIRAREIQITQLGKGIVSKEREISELEEKAEHIKESLAELLRKSDELDSYTLVEALLSNVSLSNFFLDAEDFDVLRGELNIALAEMRDVKVRAQYAKDDLEAKEEYERGLKISKEKEQRKTETYKEQKSELLALKTQEIENYKESIAEKERIKNEIRNRIFRTIGGVEMTFGEALQLILPYEERIGVEAELVLAVLTQESAIDGVIGRNLGRCTYDTPASNSSGTAMSDSQKPSFLAILRELGMNPNTTPVSCPIPSDGSYGGAMGPSQFMPNTWWDINTGYGYKRRVANVLNIEMPSPFVNLDAFVGTALYLSDAREMCAGPKGFSTTFEIWSCTAAKYYSGLQSRGSRLASHMNPTYSYGYKVAKRAQEFQKDIDLLSQ